MHIDVGQNKNRGKVQNDSLYMEKSVGLARRAWGQTHPNPMVGAVIVEGGLVVAEGFHGAAGQPHAEVEALRALGRRPREGARLYITLEPCSTQGRTPACTQAILESGIREVIVGCEDPNPSHAGRGLELLRQAGIEVRCGVERAACEDLNLIFNHWIVKKRPLIAAKWAATLDGYVATRSGASQWITGELARADVMQWRRYFPAIAVGVGTVLADNPRLTARIAGLPVWCPQRFIFDSHLRLLASKASFNVLTDSYAERTCLVTTQKPPKNLPAGVTCWTLPATAEGHVSLEAFVSRCSEEAIEGVLIEGGPTLTSGFLNSVGLDYCFAYQAPCLFADTQAQKALSGKAPQLPSQALRLSSPILTPLGDDWLVRGKLGGS